MGNQMTGCTGIRAVAVDLDDTLLRPDKSISPRTLAVWERCRARGITLIVATARAEGAAQRQLRLLRPDAVVSNAGARVSVGARVVWDQPFSRETGDGLARLLASQTTGLLMAETAEGCFWNDRERAQDPEYGGARYSDFRSPLPPVYKLETELTDDETARGLAARYPDVVLTGYYGHLWWRFSPLGADKRTGLLALLKSLGIAPEDTAAFGDDYSDEGMLAAVGWGIAMGNAVAQVKAAAREVTEDNAHDGVACWLERRVLGEAGDGATAGEAAAAAPRHTPEGPADSRGDPPVRTDCPCTTPHCPRHGDCAACADYHRTRAKNAYTACGRNCLL